MCKQVDRGCRRKKARSGWGVKRGEDYFRPCGRGSTLKQCQLKQPIKPGQGPGPGHFRQRALQAQSPRGQIRLDVLENRQETYAVVGFVNMGEQRELGWKR